MNINELRTLVRINLGDDDLENKLFSDSVIDSQINHAVEIFSSYLPLNKTVKVSTVAGSNEINLEGLDGLAIIMGIEHPVDKTPPFFLAFCHWGNTLVLQGNSFTDGSDARVYYGRSHYIDEETSTVPVHYSSLVCKGAAGLCALLAAAKSTNKINIGGTGVPAEYRAWGEVKLRNFHRELKRISRVNSIRTSRLYPG